MTHILADVFGGWKSLIKPVMRQKTCNYIELVGFPPEIIMHDDAYIGGCSENNIKCVMHDDLGWKKETTPYILPRHWLYEWFSQFHSCGTYSVLSQHPSTNFWLPTIHLTCTSSWDPFSSMILTLVIFWSCWFGRKRWWTLPTDCVYFGMTTVLYETILGISSSIEAHAYAHYTSLLCFAFFAVCSNSNSAKITSTQPCMCLC